MHSAVSTWGHGDPRKWVKQAESIKGLRFHDKSMKLSIKSLMDAIKKLINLPIFNG